MKNKKNKNKYKQILIACLFIIGLSFNIQSVNASIETMGSDDGCELDSQGHTCMPIVGTEYEACHVGGDFCGEKPKVPGEN